MEEPAVDEVEEHVKDITEEAAEEQTEDTVFLKENIATAKATVSHSTVKS